MKKNIKLAILTLGVVFGFGLAAVPSLAYAAPTTQECMANPQTAGCDNLMDYVTNIVNVMLFVLGALSVVMIIFGGIKYTISAGDAKKVESAKNTIMYAVIGLVVALLASAIVNFVIVRLLGK
jgi:chaperone required for assembly of F1-ATPase